MKIGALVFGVPGLIFVASVAAAQQVPRERLGFQMDLRTGYSLPMGDLGDGAKMSDVVNGQVPFIVDLGAKVVPELLLGGYFGLGIGGVSGVVKDGCDRSNTKCVAVGVHLGIEVQLQLTPARLVNPWIGYGVGFESLAMSTNNSNDTLGYGGFELARFMAGVDFRLNHAFGPFVDLSLARYTSVSANSRSTDLPNVQTHEWLTLGARFVFFP